jgi:hypothetical protein
MLFITYNSAFEQRFIDDFRDLVLRQGTRSFRHLFVERGRMGQQITGDELPGRIDSEWILTEGRKHKWPRSAHVPLPGLMATSSCQLRIDRGSDRSRANSRRRLLAGSGHRGAQIRRRKPAIRGSSATRFSRPAGRSGCGRHFQFADDAETGQRLAR